jgi:tRNA G18 (ribose-2'-O)-methylase SpoU
MTKKKHREVAVLLHDIRSTHNVGSIFRTSDALGVNKIYLSGYTPTPLDKYGRPRKDIAKVALGAEKTISSEYEGDPKKIIKKLKNDGFQIIGIEQTDNSVDYKKVKITDKVLFVVGNEVLGVDKKILDFCDVVAEIPMQGEKDIFELLGLQEMPPQQKDELMETMLYTIQNRTIVYDRRIAMSTITKS